MRDWQFSVVSSIHDDFYWFQLGSLNHLWWRLTSTCLDDHNFYFLPLSSPKSVQYTVHFASHVQTNAVCYTFFNWHRRKFLLTSWCCTSIRGLLFHYTLNISYRLAWGSNILMNKASSLWHSCYTFDHVYFKKLLYK